MLHHALTARESASAMPVGHTGTGTFSYAPSIPAPTAYWPACSSFRWVLCESQPAQPLLCTKKGREGQLQVSAGRRTPHSAQSPPSTWLTWTMVSRARPGRRSCAPCRAGAQERGSVDGGEPTRAGWGLLAPGRRKTVTPLAARGGGWKVAAGMGRPDGTRKYTVRAPEYTMPGPAHAGAAPGNTPPVAPVVTSKGCRRPRARPRS